MKDLLKLDRKLMEHYHRNGHHTQQEPAGEKDWRHHNQEIFFDINRCRKNHKESAGNNGMVGGSKRGFMRLHKYKIKKGGQ